LIERAELTVEERRELELESRKSKIESRKSAGVRTGEDHEGD
jgi:hypothetical protein